MWQKKGLYTISPCFQATFFFSWLLEVVKQMNCRTQCCGTDHRLKAACLPKPYLDPDLVWNSTSMLLMCGISISCDSFSSERKAEIKTGVEEISLCVEPLRRRRGPLLLSQGGSGQGNYWYENRRCFLERDLLSTCWLKHSRHSCTMLLSSLYEQWLLFSHLCVLNAGQFTNPLLWLANLLRGLALQAMRLQVWWQEELDVISVCCCHEQICQISFGLRFPGFLVHAPKTVAPHGPPPSHSCCVKLHLFLL